jgi:transcriptional regulator with XRE-family HTH domain
MMQRVHRNLSREDTQALRDKLNELVPQERAGIPELVKTMRLITRKSQAEYARFCGVAPRVLADLEAGKGSPRVETLDKLLRPFGFQVGVVAKPFAPEVGMSSSRRGDIKSGEADNPISIVGRTKAGR